MSDLRYCEDCCKYHWRAEPCDPAWEVIGAWQDMGVCDDEWRKVNAPDSETAAERYAERYDCGGGEYAIVGGEMGDEAVIYVRKPIDLLWEEIDDFVGPRFAEVFAISAYNQPTYRAELIGPPAPAVDRGDII